MKILIVIPSLSPRFGGPSIAGLGIARALAARGDEVTILTTDADVHGRMHVPLDEPVRTGNLVIKYYAVGAFRFYKFSWTLARALSQEIPRHDLVYIHSLFQFPSYIAGLYSRRFKVPYVIQPLGHLDPAGLKHNGFLKKIYFELFERSNLNGAVFIHYASEDERDQALRFHFKAPSLVLRLGIDLDELVSRQKKDVLVSLYPKLKDKKVVLFLSRVSSKKGLDILIRAFSRVAREKSDAALVIVGPDNEGYGEYLRRLIHSKKIEEQVFFTGMLLGEEKYAVLRESLFFVLPSKFENFGNAIVEAMAVGLPVIVSNRVGIYRIILQYKAGLVVSPGSVEELTLAMLFLLNNPSQALQMGRAGERLAAEYFRWDLVASEFASACEDVLKKRRAS